MKKILIALLFLSTVKVAVAQKDSLSFDEHNKYVYYHIVDLPGLTADTFQNRMLYLLKTTFPENKISTSSTLDNISGTGKFMVLSGISVVKHVDGEIKYTFHIQYKDQKYRYWLTNFIFIPYKTNNYGNPGPQFRLAVHLDNGAKKISATKFNRYINETGGYCIRFGNEVKKYMDSLAKERIHEHRKKIDLGKDW
jgi:hypothetical protein